MNPFLVPALVAVESWLRSPETLHCHKFVIARAFLSDARYLFLHLALRGGHSDAPLSRAWAPRLLLHWCRGREAFVVVEHPSTPWLVDAVDGAPELPRMAPPPG